MEGNAKNTVAFMTTKNREMFPTSMAQDRFGNEMSLVIGNPNVGPGCYENEEKTNMYHLVKTKLVSTKGYTLGARTGPRLLKIYQDKTPSPAEYQQHTTDPIVAEKDKKPFKVGAERFPVYKRDLVDVVPGAGTYEVNTPINRKVEWHQSFGSAPIMLPTITHKSTIERNTDKLYSTKEERKYHRKLAYLKLYY
ncbi:protein pitchfork-like [Physella acuta]|uniref:protein pitchfork-like n=1 Tax=Physella acuta TaxID=109671 RepID=UPI0027DC548C|nr:protein pitchfork-like [Physella acuta]